MNSREGGSWARPWDEPPTEPANVFPLTIGELVIPAHEHVTDAQFNGTELVLQFVVGGVEKWREYVFTGEEAKRGWDALRRYPWPV
jgi:hypothetical protein